MRPGMSIRSGCLRRTLPKPQLRSVLLLPLLLHLACASTPPSAEPEADRLFRTQAYGRAATLYETQAANEADPQRAAEHLLRAAVALAHSQTPGDWERGQALFARLSQGPPESQYSKLGSLIHGLGQELEQTQADRAEGDRLVRHLVRDTVELQEALELQGAEHAAAQRKLEQSLKTMRQEAESQSDELAAREELVRRLRQELDQLKRIDMEKASARGAEASSTPADGRPQ